MAKNGKNGMGAAAVPKSRKGGTGAAAGVKSGKSGTGAAAGGRSKKTGVQVSTGPIRISCGAVVMKPIGEIIPYAKNARIHGPEQHRRLRNSLREFGFVRPLLIDQAGNLIAGHGILEAAVAEGMEAVPCVLAEGLTETQRRAYVHADNRLSELSSWDQAALDLELRDLGSLDFDLSAAGFDLEIPDSPEDDGEDQPVPESSTQTKKLVRCPECGCEFSPTRKRK